MKSRTNGFLLVWTIGLVGLAWAPDNASAQEPAANEATPTQEAESQSVPPAAPYRQDSIQGEWKVASLRFAGRDLPATDLATMRLSVSAERWRNMANGREESGHFLFPETPAGRPQQADLVIEEGENAGQTLPGIIRTTESGFEACYAVSGDRPEAFETTDSDLFLLVRYERATDSAGSPARD